MGVDRQEPVFITYHVAATAVFSSAGVAKRFIGPAGRKGTIVGAEVICTTEITAAASAVKVGPAGGDADDSLNMGVPVLALSAGHQASMTELRTGGQLSADTVHEISGDGAATAGEGDITITVAWYF